MSNNQVDKFCLACVHGIPASQTNIGRVSKLCVKHKAELDEWLSQRLPGTVGQDKSSKNAQGDEESAR